MALAGNSSIAPASCTIATGDKINASILNGVPGGYLAVTNVTSAVNANGQTTDYTITAGGFTIGPSSANKISLSGQNANGSYNWVLGKQ